MSVEELQAAVAQLPPEELDRFSQWFEELLADQWDRQLEADILAGRLDAAGRRADGFQEARQRLPIRRNGADHLPTWTGEGDTFASGSRVRCASRLRCRIGRLHDNVTSTSRRGG